MGAKNNQLGYCRAQISRQSVTKKELASFNSRGFRDRSKAANLFYNRMTFGVEVVSIQQTHFVYDADVRMLSSNFAVYSAYGDQLARVKRTMAAKWTLTLPMRVWGSSSCGSLRLMLPGGACLVFTSVRAVPDGSVTLSLSGGLECHPGSPRDRGRELAETTWIQC